mgnify:CR=1 FL=1
MENNKNMIEIKHRLTGEVLFACDKEGYTLKDVVEEAVKLGASLNGASLNYASLEGASLKGANLYGASLEGANNIPYIALACPSHGAFIGWKKVADKLIQLEIPADAKRSSATSRKCRCDRAKVLAITSLDETQSFESLINRSYAPTTYKVDEVVYPDSFDDNRWVECSHGIHFFINKQDAIDYNG